MKGHILERFVTTAEDEMLTYEVSDEALEFAAGSQKAENITFAFCTGLIGCPT